MIKKYDRVLEFLLFKALKLIFQKKNFKYFIIALFCVALFFYETFFKQIIRQRNYYNYSLHHSLVMQSFDDTLKSCNQNGIYLSYIVFNPQLCIYGYCNGSNTVHFNILRGILATDKTFTVVDTRGMNAYYKIETSFDENTRNYILNNYSEYDFIEINYGIAESNDLFWFIDLYKSLGIHGAINSQVPAIYLYPHILQKKHILWIIALSFAKTENTLCYTYDNNAQKRIILDLSRQISQTM